MTKKCLWPPTVSGGSARQRSAWPSTTVPTKKKWMRSVHCPYRVQYIIHEFIYSKWRNQLLCICSVQEIRTSSTFCANTSRWSNRGSNHTLCFVQDKRIQLTDPNVRWKLCQARIGGRPQGFSRCCCPPSYLVLRSAAPRSTKWRQEPFRAHLQKAK